MGGEGQRVSACIACTRNCLMFHKTKQASLSPTSFFKIITKSDHLTTLYIPPAFSSTVSDLVNKKISLNDSSEWQWNVEISEVNGSFAFKEGWSVFSLDHGLKVGYLLVFNYVKDVHFDVKIYDPSACEKLDFPKKRTRKQKKRSRGGSGSPVTDGLLDSREPNALVVSKHHVPTMKRQCSQDDIVVPRNGEESGQLVHISEHCEHPSKSLVEFDVDKTMKIVNGDLKVSNVDYGSGTVANDAIVCSKDTTFEEILSMGAAFDISELEMSGGNTSRGEAEKNTYDKTFNLNIEENKENKAIMFSREAQVCQFSKGLESDQAAISDEEPALHIDGSCDTKQKFNGISNHLDAHIHNGEMIKLPMDMTPKLCGSMDKLNPTDESQEHLKNELVTQLGATGFREEVKEEMDSDISNPVKKSVFKTAPSLSCVVTNDNVSLKLPKYLPLTRNVKPCQHNKVVLLRDPLRRLWPVFYHEQRWLLTHGWSDFRRANNIEAEDECIFEVESHPYSRLRILAVRIVHRTTSDAVS